MTSQLDIYFPTTSLTEKELKEREVRAGTQNGRILEIFRDYPHESFTPFEIRNIWFARNWYRNVPITSIRRAMTTLTSRGYLEKSRELRIGEYGEKNHTWKLI